MKLVEYLEIRNGKDNKGRVKKVLSRAEGNIFKVDTAKSGWADTDIKITTEQVSRAIACIQKLPNIKPTAKQRLLSYSVQTNELSEKKLYLFKNEMGLCKIGISINPAKRARSLMNSSGYKISVLGVWELFDAYKYEQLLHKVFKKSRVEGEWFQSDIGLLDVENNLSCEFNRIKII